MHWHKPHQWWAHWFSTFGSCAPLQLIVHWNSRTYEQRSASGLRYQKWWCFSTNCWKTLIMIIPQVVEQGEVCLPHLPEIAEHTGERTIFYFILKIFHWPSIGTDAFNSAWNLVLFARIPIKLCTFATKLKLFSVSELFLYFHFEDVGPFIK